MRMFVFLYLALLGFIYNSAIYAVPVSYVETTDSRNDTIKLPYFNNGVLPQRTGPEKFAVDGRGGAGAAFGMVIPGYNGPAVIYS